ncbi:hypothetical protein WN48_09246 [Eufriesea mexicana]|nr:hypothetical protein WN48_09246 [Eufriesea mexicana]
MTTLKDEKRATKKSKKSNQTTVSSRSAKATKQVPSKSKQSKVEAGGPRDDPSIHDSGDNASKDVTEETARSSGRLERKSFRRKIGSLIRGSAAELPAAINRSLQPIRRSLSFSKDLNRVHEPSKPHRTISAQWYNSLVSLAEDECLDELDDSSARNNTFEELFPPKVQVTRTQSLIDTTFPRKGATGQKRMEEPESCCPKFVSAACRPILCEASLDPQSQTISQSSPSSIPTPSRVRIFLVYCHPSIITINWSIKEALYFIGQLGQSVETSKERGAEEGARKQRSSLRSLVRRLSISSGIGRYAIGSFGEGGATGPSGGGPVDRFAGAEGTEAVNGCPGGSQPAAGPGVSGAVSASAATGGRGVLSRRSSRDQSPSKSSEGQDAPTHGGGGGGGGGAGSASGAGATGPGQDLRRLVGSIKRKVRRKTGQGSASISEAALHETNRNQDDFLKATMSIFLVVSPPMGRVQTPLISHFAVSALETLVLLGSTNCRERADSRVDYTSELPTSGTLRLRFGARSTGLSLEFVLLVEFGSRYPGGSFSKLEVKRLERSQEGYSFRNTPGEE